MLILIVPPHSEANNSNSDDQLIHSNSLVPNQTTGHPEKIELNASVTYVSRNITIEPTSKINLNDAITLQIRNDTKISIFNYTIPTAFDKYVEEVKIYSQFNTSNAIAISKNIKSYDKYIGINATTYFIDITQNNTEATSVQESVHILVELSAINAIQWKALGETQSGSFIIPVFARFPNLNVEDGITGMELVAKLDSFARDNMTNVNYAGRSWPISTDANFNNLEWRNTSSVPFNPIEGLREGFDYVEAIFTSEFGDSSQVTSPYVYTDAKRHLKIDPWGKIFVTEELTIMHTGATVEQTSSSIKNIGFGRKSISINVPGDAVITSLKDELGTLNPNHRDPDTLRPITTVGTTPEKQALDVSFRNAIFGGESYTFTLEYEFRSSNRITTSGGMFNRLFALNTTMFSDFNTTVYNLESTFELPAGGSLNQHNYLPKSLNAEIKIETQVKRDALSFFRHLELKFTVTNASFVDNYEFQISYKYNGLGHFQYILTFMLLSILFLSSFVLLSKVEFASSAPVDKTRESVPSAEIDNFFKVFTERSGAMKRLSELRGKRKKGKLSKKEYDGQTKAIQRRVRELNPQLDTASKKLSNAGTRYLRLVDRIMLSSQKQQDIKVNAENARKSYLKGNSPKDIYQKLIRDYSKEDKKLESQINKSLTELLEMDQEY